MSCLLVRKTATEQITLDETGTLRLPTYNKTRTQQITVREIKYNLYKFNRMSFEGTQTLQIFNL